MDFKDLWVLRTLSFYGLLVSTVYRFLRTNTGFCWLILAKLAEYPTKPLVKFHHYVIPETAKDAPLFDLIQHHEWALFNGFAIELKIDGSNHLMFR